VTSENKQIVSWALYDWANSAFAVTILTGFFPIFFKSYLASDLSANESTYQLGLANSIASLVVVVLAPLLGSIADQAGRKKSFLFLFTFLGTVMCAALFLVQAGQWQLALVIYILSVIGFSGGVTFSDSLLVHVAGQDRLDTVSALGYALGYLGGGVLFAFCVWLTQQPDLFGLKDSVAAIQVSFLLVAVWWALFSIPVFLIVKEPLPAKQIISNVNPLRAGWAQLRQTFSEIKKLKVVMIFLIAYWLYIDGVDTVVRMAVDYGLSLNLDSSDLITALLLTQFISFPSSLLFGFMAKYIGVKQGIYAGLGVYSLVIFWAWQMQEAWEFYWLAAMIGLVQGGVQSLSRSLYARLIPQRRSAEFFGFYNMLGKFAAVIGPFMVGGITLLTGSHRQGMLSILILFISGAVLLFFVDIKKGQLLAEQLNEA